MIESYTDEELLELRKPWLDTLYRIWRGREESFFLFTPDSFHLTVFSDGEVGVRCKKSDSFDLLSREAAVMIYVKRYPTLQARGDRLYLAKTSELKAHLTGLILDRSSIVLSVRDKDYKKYLLHWENTASPYQVIL